MNSMCPYHHITLCIFISKSPYAVIFANSFPFAQMAHYRTIITHRIMFIFVITLTNLCIIVNHITKKLN